MATKKGKSKTAPVKWAIGGNEPDDLPDFVSNDDITSKSGLPPKGKHRFLVKKITKSQNKNGDDMLTVVCELADKGSKKEAKWNGYTCWERLNVTEQGAPYLKRFLASLGLKWGDFITKTVADEQSEPVEIKQIGKIKFGTAKPPEVAASVRYREYQGDEQAEIGRFLPLSDEEPDDDDIDEDEDDDDVDDDIDVDEDSDDDDEDDSEDEEDDDDEEDDEEDTDAEEELRAELTGLKSAALKKRAIRAGADEEDMPAKKAGLIDLIVELELSDEDEDDEDDEDEVDEDELRAELDELSLSELRTRAKENGSKPADLKGMKKAALIDVIVEAEAAPF